MVGRDPAAGRMVVEIHSGLDFETAAVASVKLFVTVAEIVAVADAAIDERAVDARTDAMADEVADAECAVADEAIDAVAADAGDATSDEVFDERNIQKGPAEPGVRSFHPAMLAADRYSAGMSASRQTACLSAGCSERKYCRRSRRKY